MIKLSLAVFSAIVMIVLAIEEETILKLLKAEVEESEYPLDERAIEQELYNFKNLDRTSQLLEIKRKLMQTLGGVNELYRNLGINSLRAKNQVLGILRKVQNVPDEPNDAKSLFRQVSDNLNHLITFIPNDVSSQRYGGSPQQQQPRPEAEWAPVEWRPPQGEYKPRPKPERQPYPEAEPERENGPYYPPIHPEPEGKKGYLLSAVISIVRTVKALVLYLI